MSQSLSTPKRFSPAFLPACALLSALLIPLSSHASDLFAGPAHSAVSGGVSVDRLSNGAADWHSVWAAYDRSSGADTFVVFGARHDRGDLTGHELSFSHYRQNRSGPLDVSYQLELGEGAAWAKTGVTGALHLRAGEGWVLSAGARYREFEQDISKSVFAEVEKYVGKQRFAYRLAQDVSAGAENLYSHQASLSHYYDSGAQVTVVAAAGRELNRDLGVTLPASEVLALSVRGVLPVSKDVEWLPGVTWTKQDQAYERVTASIGVRFKF